MWKLVEFNAPPDNIGHFRVM